MLPGGIRPSLTTAGTINAKANLVLGRAGLEISTRAETAAYTSEHHYSHIRIIISRTHILAYLGNSS